MECGGQLPNKLQTNINRCTGLTATAPNNEICKAVEGVVVDAIIEDVVVVVVDFIIDIIEAVEGAVADITEAVVGVVADIIEAVVGSG